MSYKSSLKNWEGLAKRDPLWSILTASDKRGNRWDVDRFFQTGVREVDVLWQILEEHEALPEGFGSAMDFGCGVGRLARALTRHFDRVVGVDAAPSMLAKAEQLHREYDNISFTHNTDAEMASFKDGSFSFILSVIVLQHIPPAQAKLFIQSFIRMLKPGGTLMFQVPSRDIRKVSLFQRLRSRIKIKERLAGIGIGRGFQMSMYCISEEEVFSICRRCGAEVVRSLYTNHTDPNYNGDLRLMTKESSVDFVSNLYIVKKV